MSRIKCSATNCGYNENQMCQKIKINVEGLFAKNKIGTFCESFLNPNNKESKTYNEMAKEMFDDGCGKENKISCSANYCKYNDKDICVAKEIHIGKPSSKYRSETECDSFELK